MPSSGRNAPRFFLSYRREDSAGHAGRLVDHLLGRFGVGAAFMDVESIAAGADFTEAITRAIADADAVLIVIGPGWLDAAGSDGSRRLEEAADFVRMEVDVALRSDVRVIPVLVGGASMPAEEHLPPAIAALAHRNAVEILDRRWREDVDALLDVLEGRDRAAPPIVPAGNLPQQPTAFLGRESEQTDVLELVRREDVRLVTLTGPGGIGKTRLAVQAASELAPEYPGGAWFVGLAALTDPALVPSEIAHVLGAEEPAEGSLAEAIAARLANARTLVVLDNLEQLLPDAAQVVAELSAGAPSLDLIASSREPLHIAAEREYPLTTLTDDEAIALFVERASASHPGFVIRDDAERTMVSAICARLDRLPLAVELAAARIRLLSPSELLERLERRLPLLTGGTRDAPERQRTLRATIAWSHDLLPEDERRLFERLAVFSGGFTLEAAEAVCGTDLDTLQGLLERSLVRERTDTGSSRRYEMLETIREFALELLQNRGHDPELATLHEDFFLSLAVLARSELRGPDPGPWFDQLENEIGNLRAAITSSLAQGRILIALRLVAASVAFWERHGHWREARAWLHEVLTRSENMLVPERAEALYAAGSLSGLQGEMSTSRSLLEQAVELARVVGDLRTLARALSRLSWIGVIHGLDVERSLALGEEGVSVARDLGDPWLLAESLDNLGSAYGDQSHSLRSVSLFEESLQLRRSIGDITGIAYSLNNLGYEAVLGEDYAKAVVYLEESLDLARRFEDRQNIVLAQDNLALAHLFDGRPAFADKLFRENLGLCQEMGDHRIAEEALIGLAGVAAMRHEWDRAAWLAGASTGLAAEGELVPSDAEARIHERYLSDARQALGDEPYEASFDRGRVAPFEEAVAYALGDLRPD